MDIILFILAIIFYVRARQLRDSAGNYYPDGVKFKNAALVCLIIGIVLFAIGFVSGFMGAL